ncbi:MAG TPA: HlyD family secretion protein [Armatimonadota bacterium]
MPGETTTPVIPRDLREDPSRGNGSGESRTPPGATSRGPRRRTLALLAAVPVLLIIAVFAGRWLSYSHTHTSTDDATVDGDIYPVSGKVGGRVLRVLVSDNQRVRRGDPLVELDPADLKVQLAEAQAALATQQASAKAALTAVSITRTTTRSASGQAKAALEAALAEAQAARQQVLVGGSQISAASANLSASEAALEDAGHAVQSAQAGVTSAQAALSAADEGVVAARQAVTGANAGLRSAQQGVLIAQADVRAAEANAKKANADFTRNRNLLAQGAISQSQLDIAEAAATTAQSQVSAAQEREVSAGQAVEQAQSAQATAQSGVAQATARRNQSAAGLSQAQVALKSARSGVQGARAKVQQARAGVQQATLSLSELRSNAAQQVAKGAQAEASLQGTATAPQQVGVSTAQAQTAAAQVRQAAAKVNEIALQLSYTRVKAPVDGVVSRKNVTEGQMVQASQPLMAVTDLHSVDVTANLKETQLKGVRVGSPAEFTVDSYPGRVFHGHVASLSPGTGAVFSLLPPENATGNFTKVVQRVPIKVAIDSGEDASHPLRLGMSAVVTVTVGS